MTLLGGRAALAIAGVLMLASCMGPPSLQRAVIGYDETTARLDQQLLLLNVARVDAGLPVHFTTTSSIAASFDWSTSAAVGGQFREGVGDIFTLDLRASGTESPTFSIVPVSGEQFTARVLTPLTEQVFSLMAFQSPDLELIIRLLAESFEHQNKDGTYVRRVRNRPEVRAEYQEFRRIALHLAALRQQDMLYQRTLQYRDVLIRDYQQMPRSLDIANIAGTGKSWRQNESGSYRLEEKVSGRIMLTNYDPNQLSDEERRALSLSFEKNPQSFVFVDIDPDHPGGDYPIHGALALRSLVKIIDFVAAGVSRSPEFDVAADPRSPPVTSGPVQTLEIRVFDERPVSNLPHIRYGDRFVTIGDDPWTRQAFAQLSYIFQTAVGEVTNPGIPITIAK